MIYDILSGRMQQVRNRRLTFLQAIDALHGRAGVEDEILNNDNEDDEVRIIPPEADVGEIVEEVNDLDNEGDIEIFQEDDSDGSGDDLEENEGNDHEHVANNIVYSENPPLDQRWRRNIINDIPRNLAHAQTELESFLLYLPENLLRMILRHMTRKAHDLSQGIQNPPNHMALFSYDEFLACIAILIRSGTDSDNFTSIDDIWSAIDGKPFYRAVISKNRFKFFIRAIRFDNYRTRQDRIQNDRLAAVSEMWSLFINNLPRTYVYPL